MSIKYIYLLDNYYMNSVFRQNLLSTPRVESANKLNAPTRIDKRQLSFQSCIGVLLRCIPRAPSVNLRVTTELSNRMLSFVLLRPFTDRKRSMISRDRRVFARSLKRETINSFSSELFRASNYDQKWHVNDMIE